MSPEPSEYSSQEDKNNEEKSRIININDEIGTRKKRGYVSDRFYERKKAWYSGYSVADPKLNVATPSTIVFNVAEIAERPAFSVWSGFVGITDWPSYMVSNPTTIQNSVRYTINTETLSLAPAQNTDQDGRLAGMEIGQMKNESETDKRFAQLEEIVLSIAHKVDSIAGKVEQITQKETISTPLDMEKEIDSILKEKNYIKLNELLNQNKEKVVDILCKKTRQGKIDLNTSEGRDIWRNVIKFHKDQNRNIDPIYSKLAECSRNERQKRLHNFIYDTLFSVNGGMNASFEAGYWAADKYAKHSLEKRKRKLQEMLAGQ